MQRFSIVSINLYAAASVIKTGFVQLVGNWTEEGEVLSPIPEGSWSILRPLLNLRLGVL